MTSIEQEMLKALELLHYSYRFRSKRFLLVACPGVSLDHLELDLRILHSARIQVVVICPDTSGMAATLDTYNSRGSRFSLLNPDHFSFLQGIESALEESGVPVVPVASYPDQAEFIIGNDVLAIGSRIGADKVFLCTSWPGLEVDDRLLSHPTPSELEELILGPNTLNIGSRLLTYIASAQIKYNSDTILLEGKRGSLFEEIFTHRGKGTLFTSNYPNEIRRAELRDAHEIAHLIQPAIRDGSIIPLSVNQIAEEIDKFSVYTINNEIVAVAKLTDYGQSVEIGKFATLPRYQGRGRAQELALALMESAAKQNKKYIFALTTHPQMCSFFEHLGFTEQQRESLPKAWQSTYDFSRPSKAFVKTLESSSLSSVIGW